MLLSKQIRVWCNLVPSLHEWVMVTFSGRPSMTQLLQHIAFTVGETFSTSPFDLNLEKDGSHLSGPARANGPELLMWTSPGRDSAGVNRGVHSAFMNVCMIETRQILHWRTSEGESSNCRIRTVSCCHTRISHLALHTHTKGPHTHTHTHIHPHRHPSTQRAQYNGLSLFKVNAVCLQCSTLAA